MRRKTLPLLLVAFGFFGVTSLHLGSIIISISHTAPYKPTSASLQQPIDQLTPADDRSNNGLREAPLSMYVFSLEATLSQLRQLNRPDTAHLAASLNALLTTTHKQFIGRLHLNHADLPDTERSFYDELAIVSEELALFVQKISSEDQPTRWTA